MKVAREAKVGLGIALVIGLIVAITAYLTLGVTTFSLSRKLMSS